MMKTPLEMRFRLVGDVLPADHGYALFSSLSRIVPWLHSASDVAILPIPGTLSGERLLKLNKRSALRIRLSAGDIPRLLPLSGKLVDLQGFRLQIGTPEIYSLSPSSKLYSRLVVVKGALDPESFQNSARRLLKTVAPSGNLTVPLRRNTQPFERKRAADRRGEPLRRTLRICNREIVGYAVLVSGLTDEDSLRLQGTGLGGRRHFGCGVFVPVGSQETDDDAATSTSSS